MTPLTEYTVFSLVISLGPVQTLVNSPSIKCSVDFSDLGMLYVSGRIGVM